MYMRVSILIVSAFLLIASNRTPQIPENTVIQSGLIVEDLTGSINVEDLAATIVGPGVTISNVTYTGAEIAAGVFGGGENIVGFDAGIILSTGSASGVIGPNQSNSYSVNNGMPGDPDLTLLSGFPTFDAAVLEFDFVPDSDHVIFQFVFASEEYNEFVFSQYNDVFAFFINGVNCALIEGDPVSINTINYGNPYGTEPNSHPYLYINNALPDGGGHINTEMDGLTEVLTCSANVIPNITNYMKLAIADASDYIYDSNVFIRAGSVTTEKRPVILLPGMTASFNLLCFTRQQIFCDDENLWGWTPTAGEYYEPLINRLNQAGYTETNGYLNILFYDWRQPIGSNVQRLKERIASVKSQTGADKVDLIGHSMGGLLARTYVQDSSYANDVSYLVTLGSPHTGSAKAYPYWQAANYYQVGTAERIALGTLMEYYRRRLPCNPWAPICIPTEPVVQTLRRNFPSFQDILPTYDYLYEDNSNQLIAESSMIHRNTFLPGLNDNIGLLFERTEGVATFVGQDLATTERFYVQDRSWWEWPNWDDGKPNWNRESEFMTQLGDGTVIAASASLPDAYVREFSGVWHSDLAANNSVINAIFTFLGISVAPLPVEQMNVPILVLFLDGPANLVVTDPNGQIVASAETIESSRVLSASTYIKGADYISLPEDEFQVVFIPNPVEGRYAVEVHGTNTGAYALGLLDTFNTTTLYSDLDDLWDVAESQIEPAFITTFALTYTVATSPTISLIAETPIIQIPVWVGDDIISGRTVPETYVEIRDTSTDNVLGSGFANEQGHFTILISNPLRFGQQIYPFSNGQAGVSVLAQHYSLYLPLILRQ
jgi:pimeloyl-ACP methyl ester carboxylesterase